MISIILFGITPFTGSLPDKPWTTCRFLLQCGLEGRGVLQYWTDSKIVMFYFYEMIWGDTRGVIPWPCRVRYVISVLKIGHRLKLIISLLHTKNNTKCNIDTQSVTYKLVSKYEIYRIRRLVYLWWRFKLNFETKCFIWESASIGGVRLDHGETVEIDNMSFVT